MNMFFFSLHAFFFVEFKVVFFSKKTGPPLGIKWDAPYGIHYLTYRDILLHEDNHVMKISWYITKASTFGQMNRFIQSFHTVVI